jgi:DNA-binding transcriptional MerR regulator
MESLKELAIKLGVPESTLRLYRDEFDELVPVAGGEGRRRRYGPEGTETLRLIVGWKREGKPAAAIRAELERRAAPRERARRRDTDGRLDEVSALLTAQAGEIALLRAEVGALRAALRELTATLRREEDALYAMEDVQAAFVAGRS